MYTIFFMEITKKKVRKNIIKKIRNIMCKILKLEKVRSIIKGN